MAVQSKIWQTAEKTVVVLTKVKVPAVLLLQITIALIQVLLRVFKNKRYSVSFQL